MCTHRSLARGRLTRVICRYPHFRGGFGNPHCYACGCGVDAGWTCCGAGVGCSLLVGGCRVGAVWEIICASNGVLSQNTWTWSPQKWQNTWMYSSACQPVYRTPQGVPEFSRGVPTRWGVPDMCSSRAVTLSHICPLLHHSCMNFSQILKPYLSGVCIVCLFPPVCL